MIAIRLPIGETLHTKIVLVARGVRAADAHLERVSNPIQRPLEAPNFTYRRCNIRRTDITDVFHASLTPARGSLLADDSHRDLWLRSCADALDAPNPVARRRGRVTGQDVLIPVG